MVDTLIPGAISSSYVLQTSNIGKKIFCRVTASNIAGEASANAVPVGIIVAGEGEPTIITGSEPTLDITAPESGDTITCTTVEADWDGTTPITFEYQWMHAVVDEDDEIVTDEYGNPVGEEILGATTNDYEVDVTDEGEQLFCIVTGTNAYGSGVAHSNVTDAVVSGVAWTPASLTGLVAWYKADTGVYSDAGTTPATDGADGKQWNDQSGNGYHLLQSDSEIAPIYDTTGFNGLPAIVCVAGDHVLMATTSNTVARGAGTQMSAFVVCQMLTGTDTAGRLLAYYGNLATNDYDNAGSAALFIRDSSSNAVGTYRTAAIASVPVSLATNMRIGVIYDGANGLMYLNNSSAASSTAASTGNFTSPGTLQIGLGGVHWAGAIAEIVVTSSAMSSGDRNSLDAYFVAKWGL